MTLGLLTLCAAPLAYGAGPVDFPPAVKTKPDLPTIKDKTLVVWCSPANTRQIGAGVLSLDRGGQFDAIVLGEVAAGKWMAGSDNFARTPGDQAAYPTETAGPDTLVQLALVYQGHEVTLYRNGERYATHTVEKPAMFGTMSQILIGLRHEALRHGTRGFFAGAVEEARLYNRALDEAQIRALRLGTPGDSAPLAMWTFDEGKTNDLMGTFPPGELFGGAYVADGKLHLDGKDDFMMTPATLQFDPDLHFRPASGVLGDAIPFYWAGQYHVFYLKGPNWGHLVSRDLVHWEELPVALEHSADPTGPDGEACWTGSITEHNGTFHLFYTGKNMNDPRGDQKVMHATSSDLVTWTKHPEDTFYADGKIYWSKPVNGAIDDKLAYHHQAFRDPLLIWNKAESQWWMLLHAARADGSSPVFALYSSPDLAHWTPRPPIYTYPPSTSGDCPDIFEDQGRWYIIAADYHYTVASQLGGPYAPEMVPYDCGEMFVPKTMFDGRRRILVGWIHDHEGHTDAGAGVWGGCLTMARELYPDAQGRLCQRPPHEVVAAFNQSVLNLPAGPEPGKRIEVPRDYMLHTQIKAAAPGTSVTIAFRQPAGQTAGGYHLSVDFSSRRIELGDGRHDFQRVCDFDPAAPMDVRLFVMGTVIECFINDAYGFTMRGYDFTGSGLTVTTAQGKAEMSDWSIYVMK